jgi:hypothetical protein
MSWHGVELADYGEIVVYRAELQRVHPQDKSADRHVMDWQPQVFWAVHGLRLYVADALTSEIRIFGADGSIERIVWFRRTLRHAFRPKPQQSRESHFSNLSERSVAL